MSARAGRIFSGKLFAISRRYGERMMDDTHGIGMDNLHKQDHSGFSDHWSWGTALWSSIRKG